jgi:hypothetical protein
MTTKNKVKMQAAKKASPRGGARIRDARSGARVERLDGQQVLLREVIHHFGGNLKLVELVQKKTGDDDFHYHNFVNWRNRRGVPLRYIAHVAKALDISEFALNYRDTSRATRTKIPSWESVVQSCKFLGPERIKYVLRFKAPNGK